MIFFYTEDRIFSTSLAPRLGRWVGNGVNFVNEKFDDKF